MHWGIVRSIFQFVHWMIYRFVGKNYLIYQYWTEIEFRRTKMEKQAVFSKAKQKVYISSTIKYEIKSSQKKNFWWFKNFVIKGRNRSVLQTSPVSGVVTSLPVYKPPGSDLQLVSELWLLLQLHVTTEVTAGGENQTFSSFSVNFNTSCSSK